MILLSLQSQLCVCFGLVRCPRMPLKEPMNKIYTEQIFLTKYAVCKIKSMQEKMCV